MFPFKVKETTKFILEKWDTIPLERIDSETLGRKYKTPEGHLYPSVTTLLSYLDKDILDRWIQRVGVEEAERIKNRSANRGTFLHDIIEKYLLGNLTEYKTDFLTNDMFLGIKKLLDKKVTKVYLTETAVYSDLLMCAGTLDLLCEYDGELALCDFKNSLRIKSEEFLKSYYLQLTAYSIMLKEIYNVDVKKCVIILGVEYEKQPQVVEFSPEKYKNEFYNFRKKVYLEYKL